MIMYRYRERLLGQFLADDVLIELRADFRRLWDADGRALPLHLVVELLVEDALADSDAAVANVHARSGDEFAHLRAAFATEGAHRQVAGARHR